MNDERGNDDLLKASFLFIAAAFIIHRSERVCQATVLVNKKERALLYSSTCARMSLKIETEKIIPAF